MKRFVRLLLIIGAMVLCSIPALAAEEEETPLVLVSRSVHISDAAMTSAVSEAVWRDDFTTYGQQLNGAAKEIYTSLVERFAADEVIFEDGMWSIPDAFVESWRTNGNLQAELSAWFYDTVAPVIEQAVEAFVLDYPEYFWIRYDFTYNASASFANSVATGSVKISFTAFQECDTAEEIADLQQRMDAVIDDLMEQTEGMSDAAKLAYFDSWLVDNNTYNDDAAYTYGYNTYVNMENGGAYPWTALSGILDGYEPVCEGYSHALQLLCKNSGITCVPVSGTANDGGHMWVAVKLDGQWYMIDSTWNDPDREGQSSLRTYLLVSMPNTHTVSMVLASPPISRQDYFTWERTGSLSDGIFGGEAVAEGVNCWVALYNADGRLIAVELCESFAWNDGEVMCIAPEFSDAALSAAATAKLFRLSADGWLPMGNALPLGGE